jgi:probable HAF family extracellular repeat protein
MRTTFFLSAILLTCAATAASAQTLPAYRATVVGTAPFSPSCFVSNLSDTGIQAGTCDPYGTYKGGIVSWRNGVATSFGKLPKGTFVQNRAVNSSGVVVGEGDTGDGRPHALVTFNGGLLQMKDGGVNDRAIGVTDSGVIFGNLIKSFDGQWLPVQWAPDPAKPDRYRATMLPLYNDGGDPKVLGGTLLASSNAGHAVGWANGSVIGQLGGFWNNDAAHTPVALSPLPGGWHSIAWGVNDLGQAVGESNSPLSVYTRAVLWQNDAAHSAVDLGALPGDTDSRAIFINDAGQIVGYSGNNVTGSSNHTFLYQDGVMADLSSLIADPAGGTWEIMSVAALNNAGQFIVAAKYNGQLYSNILLTPIQ